MRSPLGRGMGRRIGVWWGTEGGNGDEGLDFLLLFHRLRLLRTIAQI